MHVYEKIAIRIMGMPQCLARDWLTKAMIDTLEDKEKKRIEELCQELKTCPKK